MIFVTVGTHYHGFERLIKKMDEVSLKIDENVVMQIGNTEYEPKNCEYYKFVEEEQMLDLYKNSDVIVAHGGEGTLMDALSFVKPVIVVPRLKKFHEHTDDHQIEISEALESQGKVIVIYDVNRLENALVEAKKMSLQQTKKSKTLAKFLEDYLRELKI
ncbi:MAG: PssE/Cps14G family polysaccharide biosynthesis glycosyltransferase [Methanobacterium sp.]